jgi:hypothetical protein
MSEADDETNLSEITIQPDGRVYVFGASLPILQILQSLQPNDRRLEAIIRSADKCNRQSPDSVLDSSEART